MVSNIFEKAGFEAIVVQSDIVAVHCPLRRFDNVLLPPHNAGITHECNYNMAKGGAEQWLDIFAARRPPRLINSEAWDRFVARYETMFR